MCFLFPVRVAFHIYSLKAVVAKVAAVPTPFGRTLVIQWRKHCTRNWSEEYADKECFRSPYSGTSLIRTSLTPKLISCSVQGDKNIKEEFVLMANVSLSQGCSLRVVPLQFMLADCIIIWQTMYKPILVAKLLKWWIIYSTHTNLVYLSLWRKEWILRYPFFLSSMGRMQLTICCICIVINGSILPGRAGTTATITPLTFISSHGVITIPIPLYYRLRLGDTQWYKK